MPVNTLQYHLIFFLKENVVIARDSSLMRNLLFFGSYICDVEGTGTSGNQLLNVF
jgi:hypothetical protein